MALLSFCSRSAKQIISTCQSYSNYDEDMKQKTVLLEAAWVKIEIQLQFLSKVSHLLEEELARCQFRLVQILNGKLAQAVSQLQVSTIESSVNASTKLRIADRFKKWKWVLKNSLTELVADLEAWQGRFDPTWYLTILTSSEILDSKLQSLKKDLSARPDAQLNPLQRIWDFRSVSNSQDRANLYYDPMRLRIAEETPIPFSSAKTIVREGKSGFLIIEAVTCAHGSHESNRLSAVRSDVEKLARKLHQIDPDTFGLLRCGGLMSHRDPSTKELKRIDMIYNAPLHETPPVSLRQLLLTTKRDFVSISIVVRIAKQLVRSISYIHTCDFVHKDVRPENVLVFSSSDLTRSRSFLVGFNQFRSSSPTFQTNLLGDPAWHRNLYRHPQRQGIRVQDRYVMQHDIYSLGVCLLEIGLWRSFVKYPNDDPTAAPYSELTPALRLTDGDFENAHLTERLRIVRHLVELAKRRLPSRVGDVYKEVVLACLTCLEPGNEMFGSKDVRDDSGVIVGVRFVEEILARISTIEV